MAGSPEQREAMGHRLLRDIIIGVIGGVVIETTVKYFDLESLFPALPYIWLGILGFLTLDALKKSDRLETWALQVYAAPNRRRKQVLSYVVVFLIGGAVLCGYWWGISRVFSLRHKGQAKAETSRLAQPGADNVAHAPATPEPQPHSRSATAVLPALPPLIKDDAFSSSVVLDMSTGWPLRPPPTFETIPTSRDTSYSAIASLAGAFVGNPGTEKNDATRPRTQAERTEFVAELLQYYLLDLLDIVQSDSRGVGILVGKGSQTIVRQGIKPPQEVRLPNKDMLAAISHNRFAQSKYEQVVWSGRKLRVPYGAELHLEVEPPSLGRPSRVVRIERPRVFKFILGVEPTFVTPGVPIGFPGRYDLTRTETYGFAVSMHFEFQRNNAFSLQEEDYARWADSVFAAFKTYLKDRN